MYIKVKILPGARKEQVNKVGKDDNIVYKIDVKEKAEGNRANKRLLEIMKGLYPKAEIRLISGHHSRSKIISIEDKE